MLQQLATYNIWANQRMLDELLKLDEDTWKKELAASFPSFHGALLHMWDAESIWWQRMKLQEVVVAPSVHFIGTVRDIGAALLHQNKLWKSWIDNATIAALEHVFAYQNSRRQQFKLPIYQMLMHVFNHGTYHRGQLIVMMHQAGIARRPQTDFIVWTRLKGKQKNIV